MSKWRERLFQVAARDTLLQIVAIVLLVLVAAVVAPFERF